MEKQHLKKVASVMIIELPTCGIFQLLQFQEYLRLFD
jgi:hypothetical protein